MALPILTFNGITQERFQAIAIQVKAQTGVAVSGNTGTAAQSGFRLTWNYVPGAQTLTIQCLDKPFFAPASMVQSKITDLVEQTKE